MVVPFFFSFPKDGGLGLGRQDRRYEPKKSLSFSLALVRTGLCSGIYSFVTAAGAKSTWQ